ncbi:MAG TPA: hypothetical protein VJP80_06135 [Candidatus Saccharimonadales bacterium]|nr:hypothetical protein [Candidatus Saccharimonadales bacterium]
MDDRLYAQSHSYQKKILATLAVLVVTVVIVLGVKALTKQETAAASLRSDTGASSTQSASASTTSSSSSSVAPSSATSTSGYKDGTYTAAGSYDSPAGIEDIKVTVTLQAGVVTATSAQNEANDRQSQQFQADFISSYKQYVVGRNISSLQLTNVAGASLTSQGFNDAIDQIKSQAKA